METIHLNNFAASLLSAGNHEHSVCYLQKALATLREQVNADMAVDDDHPACSCHHHSPPLTIVSTCDPKLAASSATVENAFEFYDKVFMVSFDGCCCDRQVEKLQNMLLAVISKSQEHLFFSFLLVSIFPCI